MQRNDVNCKHTRIWLGQQLHNREQNLADCQCGRPIILDSIKTNNSVGINITVIDTSTERNLLIILQ